MDNLFHVPAKLTKIVFGHSVTLNLDMLVMTWIIMVLIIVFAFVSTWKLKEVPGKIQSVFELFTQAFKELVISTLGEEDGPRYIPLIATIFIFVLLSNWIGVIPHISAFIGMVIALFMKLIGMTNAEIVYESIFKISFIPPSNEWYSFFFKVPPFSEPTKYLATDLGLALIVAFVVHGAAIKEKGIIGYLKSYADPIWVFYPLNVISEMAKVVSHSFRLFGNILGGSIIFIIVSKLIMHIILPVGLSIFFGLFVGAIQAFVFAMLAVTYIAVATK